MKQINNNKWLMLVILSLIWGSAYILIKRGLVGLTPFQLGSFRVVFTTVTLLLIGYRSLKSIRSAKTWFWLAVSGFLGTFFPVFLFPFAQTQLDSGVTSILNSMVPLFTLIFGSFLFRFAVRRNQFVGVLIGLLGSYLLVLESMSLNAGQNYWYAGFVVMATICYAVNVNIIKRFLQEVSPLGIAVANFIFICIPALVIMITSGFFELNFESEITRNSILYIILLSIASTTIAKVMFNRLVQISNPVFSSSVTYTIPIIGLLWGVADSERISLLQIGAMGIILTGVYLVNKSK